MTKRERRLVEVMTEARAELQGDPDEGHDSTSDLCKAVGRAFALLSKELGLPEEWDS